MTHLVVAIPARNEEARIARVLDAVATATARLTARHPDATVTLVVAADACTDRTAAIARDRGAEVVESAAGRVGGARRSAVGRALALRPDATWIANTDADSQVPANWLLVHHRAAVDGTDLLLGAVRPDPRETPLDLLRRWMHEHPITDDHPYVHGANLGVRAAAYRAAGGFRDVPSDEDVGLVDRCRALGLAVRSTAGGAVLTSGRTSGRAPDGFSGFLRRMAAER